MSQALTKDDLKQMHLTTVSAKVANLDWVAVLSPFVRLTPAGFAIERFLEVLAKVSLDCSNLLHSLRILPSRKSRGPM
jgi:hypothetical protein